MGLKWIDRDFEFCFALTPKLNKIWTGHKKPTPIYRTFFIDEKNITKNLVISFLFSTFTEQFKTNRMKLEKFLENIITPDFLQLVEKWARYQGPKLSVNDDDIHVENKGVFKKVTTMPKLIWGKGSDFSLSKTENEKHTTLFDVTMITNSAVCSDHFIRVLIAERFPEGDDEYFKKKLPKLFIFSVKRGKSTPDFPSFPKLKKDFEEGGYKPYNSMLYNFCDIYKLSPFNEHTDRIFNFTGIESDLECLECTDESIEASKDIVTSDWKNNYQAHKDLLMGKVKPQFKQE